MQKKGLVQVNLAVLLFGMAGVLAKWIHIPAVGITFFRVLFSSASLFLFCMVTKTSIQIKEKRDMLALVVAGCVLATHWCTFLGSIKMSTVAIGTITFSTFPLFVTFLEPMVFHEKLRGKDVLTAILVLVGVFITVPEFSLENSMSKGIALGMLSSLTYAILSLINRKFMGKYPSTVISFYEQGTAMVVLVPAIMAQKIAPTGKDITLLIILGVITTAVAHTLFVNSLKYIKAKTAGIVSSMESVYGILLACILLGEQPGIRELIGAAIILGVVVATQIAKEN